VEEILSVCGDEKSRRFYEIAAKNIPKARIFQALSVVEDADRTGQITKSKGAYFTTLLKYEAKELSDTKVVPQGITS
jgi:hypothetical protein